MDLQVACSDALPAEGDWLARCAVAAVSRHRDDAELSLRLVGEEEARRLNRDHRDADYAPNVLAFPFEAADHTDPPLLGDIVVCLPVVAREAREQQKSVEHHLAHMIVHGALHLLGFEHDDEPDAAEMEAEERGLLAALGIADPYRERGRPASAGAGLTGARQGSGAPAGADADVAGGVDGPGGPE